jgi:hypothetical protein
LLQITDGTGAVEELPLELRGKGIPAHKHGRAQALQNLLFFLGKGSTVVVILSPLNRLIDMDCHPLFVFRKRRVGLLEIAEFPRFIRRTRYVGEQRPEFGCFGSVLLRSERELPKKTQTYRSLRFLTVAALVPSAGTITLQIELRSDVGAVSTPHPVRVRALCGARPAHRKGNTENRDGPREARHSRAPNFDIAKVVQNRNGSAPAQLRSVTQQRRRMHSIGGGSPHYGT